MTGTTQQTGFAALALNVSEAQERLATARRAAAVARNEETTALNDLNSAQKALDAAYAELRKDAPRESDWGAQRSQKGGASIV